MWPHVVPVLIDLPRCPIRSGFAEVSQNEKLQKSISETVVIGGATRITATMATAPAAAIVRSIRIDRSGTRSRRTPA